MACGTDVLMDWYVQFQRMSASRELQALEVVTAWTKNAAMD
jgi:hypothetical protein